VATRPDVDALIREALKAEDAEGLDQLGEPGLPELAFGVMKGRQRWLVWPSVVLVLGCMVAAVYCVARFEAAGDTRTMLLWGGGFFLSVGAIGGWKIWYWLQMERLASARAMKRVELLVAHLITEVRARG
jgi:hypothetical protein